MFSFVGLELNVLVFYEDGFLRYRRTYAWSSSMSEQRNGMAYNENEVSIYIS